MHFFVHDWDNLPRGAVRMCCYKGVSEAHGYLLNMSDTISTSVSAAAIFSAEESWGRPPKRKDIMSNERLFA